jgi:uracil-DNA glycosylase
MADQIDALLQQMHRDYANTLKLDCIPHYHSGAPLRPVVPLDCGIGSVLVLGAYPSARFMTVDKTTDVPSADNLGPFENERWFDGQRIRRQPSAIELDECFLKPLGLARAECWVTDLVKVFLFKPGHVQRYNEIGAQSPAGYERERFFDLGRASLPWIRLELEIAKPRLLLSLGAEVAGVIHNVSHAAQQVELLRPVVTTVSVDGYSVPTMHCAHPGILMRKSPSNPWPERNATEYVPAIRKYLGCGV